MVTSLSKVLVVLDDREHVAGELVSIVGDRCYGDIVYRRVRIADYIRSAVPAYAAKSFFRLKTEADLDRLRDVIQNSGVDTAIAVISNRAGFDDLNVLQQLLLRLPYAEEDFTDRLYHPLFVFLTDAHRLLPLWSQFEVKPITQWERGWNSEQRLRSAVILDLAQIKDFLLFTSGSTATRHFNEVSMDAYFYTKSSADKEKMRAEYSFYSMVPEAMRPWLVEPFDFKETVDRASYRMMRYYVADAATQWVHGAFNADAFTLFIDRLFFFLNNRPQRNSDIRLTKQVAESLFVEKVGRRVESFLASPEGGRVEAILKSTDDLLSIKFLYTKYLEAYRAVEGKFVGRHLVVGHGDPCLSNVLYDQHRHFLKLIDPRGALEEESLWTHPLYDLAKVSHSVLGDYDFINNGLFSIELSDSNKLALKLHGSNNDELKAIFLARAAMAGYEAKFMRLAEASLFLSMLPLHIDHPKKISAFVLKAREILDEY